MSASLLPPVKSNLTRPVQRNAAGGSPAGNSGAKSNGSDPMTSGLLSLETLLPQLCRLARQQLPLALLLRPDREVVQLHLVVVLGAGRVEQVAHDRDLVHHVDRLLGQLDRRKGRLARRYPFDKLGFVLQPAARVTV